MDVRQGVYSMRCCVSPLPEGRIGLVEIRLDVIWEEGGRRLYRREEDQQIGGCGMSASSLSRNAAEGVDIFMDVQV